MSREKSRIGDQGHQNLDATGLKSQAGSKFGGQDQKKKGTSLEDGVCDCPLQVAS